MNSSRWLKPSWGAPALLGGCLLAAAANAQTVSQFPGGNALASIAYEDAWPGKGDSDYNDFVVNYRYTVRSDAADRIEEIRVTFQPVAVGSILDLGLALRIPVASDLPDEYAVTLQAQDDPEPTVLNAVSGEPELTWVLLSNVRSAFCDTCPNLAVNTQPENSPIIPQQFEVLALFNPPIEANLEHEALDFFVFRTDNFFHQIHLPQYKPHPHPIQAGGQCPELPDNTIVYSCELFGSQDDCSNSIHEDIDNTGHFFVDCEGAPWAIDRVFVSLWPKEGISIKKAFPNGVLQPGKPELLYNLTRRISVPVLQSGSLLSLLVVLFALGVKRAVGR